MGGCRHCRNRIRFRQFDLVMKFRTYEYRTETKEEVYEPRQLRFHDLFRYVKSLNIVSTDLPLSVNGKKVVDIKFNRDNGNIDLITEI